MQTVLQINKSNNAGIFDGVSSSEYHSDKNSYSSSFIKKMKVPALAKYALDNPMKSNNLRIGTAVHYKILEPHKFADHFILAIDSAKRSKDDKAEWAQFFTENGANGGEIIKSSAVEWFSMFEEQTGKQIITRDDLEMIGDMSDSIYSNAVAFEILQGGKPELSIYWQDEETGLNLRARPDYFNSNCVDLKTAVSASPALFAKQVHNLGYHISQAMYLDGIKQVTGESMPFKFVVIEKTAPYLCAVYELDDDSSDLGYRLYRKYLNRLAACLQSDNWPGLDNKVLSLPAYAFKDDEDE